MFFSSWGNKAAFIVLLEMHKLLWGALGLKQIFVVLRVLCQHFFNLCDSANSIIKIPKVRSAAAGVVANTALACVPAYTGAGKWLHTLCAHPSTALSMSLDNGPIYIQIVLS